MFELDRPQRHKPRQPSGPRWEDEARFIRTWFENPKVTGAVSPSGRALSRTMARYVDPGLSGPVVELGPGTGPVTEALIRRGIPPHRLVLVEYDATFCKLLARRYPGCTIVQGDAYALGETLGGVLDAPAAAIVSSLPLLNRPERERLRLLGDAFELSRPDASFIQFTYGLLSPMPKHGTPSGAWFDAKVSAPVWLNLPPARVWVYRRSTRTQAHGPKPDLIDKLKAGRDKLGLEFREHRDRLRAELLARSAEAKAGWKVRSQKIKVDLKCGPSHMHDVDEDFVIGSPWSRPNGSQGLWKDRR